MPKLGQKRENGRNRGGKVGKAQGVELSAKIGPKRGKWEDKRGKLWRKLRVAFRIHLGLSRYVENIISISQILG